MQQALKRKKNTSDALPRIDTRKILQKVPVAEVKDSVILLDPKNKIHQKWMED